MKRKLENGEPKNIILELVQKGYKPLRDCKLPAFIYRTIGPTNEISENLGHPIATVPCLH